MRAGVKRATFAGSKPAKASRYAVALLEDRLPAQAGLRPLERDELEEHAVVVDGHTPFFVVIGDAERRARPAASRSLGHFSMLAGPDFYQSAWGRRTP